MIYIVDNQCRFEYHILQYVQSDLHSVPEVIVTIQEVLNQKYGWKLMAVLKEVEVHGLPVIQLPDWVEISAFSQDLKIGLWIQLPPGMIKYLYETWMKQAKSKDKNWRTVFNSFSELYNIWVENYKDVQILG